MIAFASLGSGSRGNAACVRMGDALLLIDCGFSLRQAEARLERLGVHAADIDAILVTHEHSDHASGVPALAARYGIEVHATHGTLVSFAPDALARVSVATPVQGGHPFSLKGVTVTPVTVPHDAREPVQFVFDYCDRRIGVISDLGCLTPHVLDCYQGCHGLLLESNHDREMLMRGSYPPRLKRRIAGDLGHLSNSQAGEFLAAVAMPEMDVVIGHVSEQNNHPTFSKTRSAAGAAAYARSPTPRSRTARPGRLWMPVRRTAARLAVRPCRSYNWRPAMAGPGRAPAASGHSLSNNAEQLKVENVFAATPENFQPDVIDRSRDTPVLVLFWADQVPPSAEARQRLEAMVGGYGGKVVLALVDVAQDQTLAQHLRVQALPSIRVIDKGQVVHQLDGPQPDEAIRGLLDQLTLSSGDLVRSQIEQLLEAGEFDRALAILRQAIGEEPGNTAFRVELADLLVRQGDLDGARTALAGIPEDTEGRTGRRPVSSWPRRQPRCLPAMNSRPPWPPTPTTWKPATGSPSSTRRRAMPRPPSTTR